MDRNAGSGMDWNNVLVGLRSRLLGGQALQLDGWGSVSRFVEDADNVPARYHISMCATDSPASSRRRSDFLVGPVRARAGASLGGSTCRTG